MSRGLTVNEVLDHGSATEIAEQETLSSCYYGVCQQVVCLGKPTTITTHDTIYATVAAYIYTSFLRVVNSATPRIRVETTMILA